MPDDNLKLYRLIGIFVKEESNKYANKINMLPGIEPERRDGHDRRKGKYIPAQVRIKMDDAEMTAIGHTASATHDDSSATVSATGAYIQKN
jgi:hypothetical protein